MKNKLLWIGIGSVVLGISAYFGTQWALAKKIAVKVVKGKTKVTVNSLENITIDTVISVTNTTQVNINIRKMVVDVYVNDVFVSKVLKESSIELLPNTETITPIQIAFNPKQLVSNIGSIFNVSNINSIPIKIKATATIEQFGIPIPVPVTVKTTVGELMS